MPSPSTWSWVSTYAKFAPLENEHCGNAGGAELRGDHRPNPLFDFPHQNPFLLLTDRARQSLCCEMSPPLARPSRFGTDISSGQCARRISAAVTVQSVRPSPFHGRCLSSNASKAPADDRKVRALDGMLARYHRPCGPGCQVAWLAWSSTSAPWTPRMPQALRVKGTTRELVCVSGE